jgi:hypothetical protein
MRQPSPAVHDEFSYLLAADTFAQGRLTNPPHPFWQHFETFHVLQQPTYASKYPPLQGMALAIGEWLGNPWLGVCLSVGLMCGAICWMLQGWLTPTAAFFGALIAAIQIGFTSYWMNSYWGGAVAALAGALVLGAMGRLRKKIEVKSSVLFFAGVAILINSRPFEGTVLTAIAGAALFFEARHKPGAWRLLGRKFVPAGAALMLLTAAGMSWYNFRVTGSALRLPYFEYEKQYATTPPLLWGETRTAPLYRHDVMRRFSAEFEAQVYETTRQDPVGAAFIKMFTLARFFVGNVILLAPLMVPGIWRSRKTRLCLVMLGAFLLALTAERFVLPHYAAPAAGLFFLIYASGWRWLRYWRPMGKPYGCAIAYALLGLMMLQASRPRMVDAFRLEFSRQRGEVVARLQREPGQHLVIVRYAQDHNVHAEWVYNSADIDASNIVWAREMGPELDRPMIQYFAGRKVWLLEPDGPGPPCLRAYQEASQN